MKIGDAEKKTRESHAECSANTNRKYTDLVLGVDIGTTTISAALVERQTGKQIDSFTLPNDSAISNPDPARHEQDPGRIVARVDWLINSILNVYPQVCAIGFTGQMHGILYVDDHGNALSPLFTWQDTRADAALCSEIGGGVRPGYGLATHVYNVRNNLTPQGTASFCTIMDYAVMHLTGRTIPLMHPSNADSIGLYQDGKFHTEKLKLPDIHLPEIGEGFVGTYKDIPVMTALGDNQASFLAADNGHGTVLINFGTGSQISMVDSAPSCPLPPSLERRPYIDGKQLIVGSALCGGKAYALLERFFRGYCGEPQYERLNALALQAIDRGIKPLKVRTTFCGTRENPTLLGCIDQISESNFTPQALTLGVLQGMADELYKMLLSSGIQPERIVTSGNAVQKNPAFQQILSQTFGMSVEVSAMQEEAATGAALFAAMMLE